MNTNPVFFIIGYKYKDIIFMQENGHIYKTKSAAKAKAEELKQKDPKLDWGIAPFKPVGFDKI